jgi:hypothetical protein
LAERDKLVFSACQHIKLPVAITMSGGYAKDINDTADIHFQTVQIALAYSKNGAFPHDNL